MPLPLTRTNERGNVLGAGLHDSEVVGLVYEAKSVLALRLRRVDGHAATVPLRGVGPVGFVGLRDGASVSTLFMWPPAEASLSVEPSQPAWLTLFGGDIPADVLPSVVGPIVAKDEFGLLVFLDCSYGGAIAALCQELELEVDGA